MHLYQNIVKVSFVQLPLVFIQVEVKSVWLTFYSSLQEMVDVVELKKSEMHNTAAMGKSPG